MIELTEDRYILRAVCRRADGVIGLTLDQRIIVASGDAAAIEQAHTLELDLNPIGANAVYLTSPDGRAIWSLHIPNDGDANGSGPCSTLRSHTC